MYTKFLCSKMALTHSFHILYGQGITKGGRKKDDNVAKRKWLPGMHRFVNCAHEQLYTAFLQDQLTDVAAALFFLTTSLRDHP